MFANGVLEAIIKRGEEFRIRRRHLVLVPQRVAQLPPQSILRPPCLQVSSSQSYPASSLEKEQTCLSSVGHSLGGLSVLQTPTPKGASQHKVSFQEALCIPDKKIERLT